MSLYVIKRHGDIIDGPFDLPRARECADELNAQYQTSEYRLEVWVRVWKR